MNQSTGSLPQITSSDSEASVLSDSELCVRLSLTIVTMNMLPDQILGAVSVILGRLVVAACLRRANEQFH